MFIVVCLGHMDGSCPAGCCWIIFRSRCGISGSDFLIPSLIGTGLLQGVLDDPRCFVELMLSGGS